jgi:hypothetical protein
MVNAEDAWQQRAKDIREGNLKSMLDILEERGFVNQIVGFVGLLEKLASSFIDNLAGLARISRR